MCCAKTAEFPWNDKHVCVMAAGNGAQLSTAFGRRRPAAACGASEWAAPDLRLGAAALTAAWTCQFAAAQQMGSGMMLADRDLALLAALFTKAGRVQDLCLRPLKQPRNLGGLRQWL